MDRPKLSVVLTAAATAPAVGSAKEPPRRPSLLKSQFSPASIERRAFNYDWQKQLADITPHSHPQMPFTLYSDYEARLYRAVKIINMISAGAHPETAEDVLEAFSRLRAARHDDNRFRRLDNRGRSDFDMKGEDMEALLQLAMVARPGSSLRARLESEWLRGTLQRDNERDAWQLRTDLTTGLNGTIPHTDEEYLYKSALAKLAEKDARAAKMEASGLSLV
jgi:hypothetical protein